ncbi:MAG: DHH family phosphoesterase [Candidatus Bathyarchaeota archaeon]|nr:DHH family phosphoesterase [Candidatus Bathyarchaeota archaeon]MCX8177383.1 DHH family phosphoesterase [Candidatus Bathyarchaeota archaeon]MDW8193830.1 DHH family phosphoesterase [Nitrososphaerota archaeon]
MSTPDFRRLADQAVNLLRSEKSRELLVVHHDDADGLCSAAILKEALRREGFTVTTLCLEKVYPEVIADLHSRAEGIILYADIGSSHADLISDFNHGRSLTIILDHHDPKPSRDPRVLDLNLENLGFKGETDFSGATCCYLFAKALNTENLELAYLALVGSFEIPKGYLSINKTILDEALKNGIIKVKGKNFEISKLNLNVDVLFSKLQILGAVGYYVGGPDLGIDICLHGVRSDVEKVISDLEEKRKVANRKLLEKLYREGFNETDHIQWFEAGKVYTGMGTKVIGQFCSFLSYQTRLIKPNKYILGIVDVPPEIPKWGRLKDNFIKASVRVPEHLQKLIDNGRLPGAVSILEAASKGFGMADGHQYAASVIVPAGKKLDLINNAEKAVCVSKGS